VEGYYIAAGTLAVWAVIVTAIGVRKEDFPATRGATRLVAAISIVLVAATIGLAIYLSATEEHEEGGAEHSAFAPWA
jgi:phosphate/sulfate permease